MKLDSTFVNRDPGVKFQLTWGQDTPDEYRFARRMFEAMALESSADLASLGAVTRKEELGALFDSYWRVEGRRLCFARSAEREAAGLIWIQPDASLVFDGASWLIVCLAVEPHWRRRGLGRLLIEHIQHAAAESGVQRLRLFTHSRNTAALTLYDACHFVPESVEMRWHVRGN